jgi:hypothetical protein
MAFISKEVPSGLINGVNTVYTLAYNVYTIDDIWIDGAIYTGSAIVSGAQVTLGDAPTVDLYVDYFTSTPSSPVLITGLSIATIRDRVRQDLKIDPGKNIWTDAQLERWANEAINIIYTQSDLKLSFLEDSIALVAGTDKYSFAGDYRKMLYAKIVSTTGETDIPIITDGLAEFKTKYDMTETGDSPQYVFEEVNQLGVWPVPTATAATNYTIKVGYVSYTSDLTSTQIPTFPSKWHYIVEYYVRYRALRAIPGKEQTAQLALTEWEKWLRIALADILWRQNEALTFYMPILPFKRRK